MKNQPLVSVCILTKNSDKTISRTIESVLNQSYRHFEIIIVDDNSSDKTLEIIFDYMLKKLEIGQFENEIIPEIANRTEKNFIMDCYSRDKRNRQYILKESAGKEEKKRISDILSATGYCREGIKLIEERNSPSPVFGGIPNNRNICLQAARGDYISWIDSDDIMHPDRLGIQVQLLEQNREIFACGSWALLFGDRYGYIIHPVDYQEIRATQLFNNPFVNSSVTMRNIKGLSYNSAIKYTEDYDFWIRFADNYRIINIPEYLVFYRLHGTQISAACNSERRKSDVFDIRMQLLKHLIPGIGRDEAALHEQLVQSLSSNSVSKKDFIQYSGWLSYLIRANDEVRHYERTAFICVILKFWLALCKIFFRSRESGIFSGLHVILFHGIKLDAAGIFILTWLLFTKPVIRITNIMKAHKMQKYQNILRENR